MAFVSQKWYLGNGESSTEYSPVVIYESGLYTVTVVVVDEEGNEYSETKELYIRVAEENQSLANKEYLDTPFSLHYNWDGGWSEYAGDNWIWPATSGSVTEFEEDGIIYTLAWDINDGKRYVVNTRDLYNQDAVYFDKDIYPIETSIRLADNTGAMEHYDVTHLDTYLRFSPERLEEKIPDDFSVDVSLITNEKQEPVETQKDINTGLEVEFFYSNAQTENTQTRQLLIETSQSSYQLTNHESYFKTNDRFRTPAYGVVNEPQEYFASAVYWYTEGLGYQYNRADGTKTVVTYTEIAGPDGRADSAADLTSEMNLLNTPVVDGALTFWYKDSLPSLPVTTVDYGTKGDWTLAYFNGEIPAEITFPANSQLFDIRIMDSVVSQENLDTYFNNVIQYVPEY